MSRSIVLGLVALVLAAPAAAQRLTEEWGLDYRGGDYTSMRARDAGQCQNACSRDSRCRAYTFRLDNGDCFLKDSVRSPKRDSNAVSGVKGGGSDGGWNWGDTRDLSEDWDTDRRGGDYATVRLDGVRACKAACSRDARCRAYTFRLESDECFLKDDVYPARRERDKVSGVKSGDGGGNGGGWGGGGFEESVGLDRRGGDYAAFSTRSPDDCKRACARDRHCRAYTFLLDERRCYLKDEARALQRNSNAVTGTKRGD